MNSLPRRRILHAAAATALAGALSGSARAQDDSAKTKGPQEWGGWFTNPAGNKHMPVVSSLRHGDQVKISLEVRHPQAAAHHISNIRIYDADRIEIATLELHPTLSTPQGALLLRVPAGTNLYAVSNCNKHGLWYSAFTV